MFEEHPSQKQDARILSRNLKSGRLTPAAIVHGLDVAAMVAEYGTFEAFLDFFAEVGEIGDDARASSYRPNFPHAGRQ